MAKADLIAQAKAFEGKISQALVNAFAQLRSSVKIRRVENLIKIYGLQGAEIAIGELAIDGTIDQHLVQELQEAINTSGRLAVKTTPKKAIMSGTFRFDILSPLSANQVRNHGMSLVHNISNNTRQALTQSLQRDVLAGSNPLYAARNFRAALGLTPNQETAVHNFRVGLENLDKQILQRSLRDARFDPTVLNSIKNNDPIPKKKIDKMVDAYRTRSISHRAKTIARTEAMRAVNMGRDMAMGQMIDQRVIDANNMRQFWIYTKDARTRDPHTQVPGLNGGGAGLPMGQIFQTPLGPMRYPLDPQGTAANTINCRCVIAWRVV